MYGIKVILKTLVILLVVCALVILWCDNPACGVFTARCVASLFIVIAVFVQRDIAKL